jgi:hypothetical protein
MCFAPKTVQFRKEYVVWCGTEFESCVICFIPYLFDAFLLYRVSAAYG